MKISIITATLNNKAGVLRAIESVRSQTYKNVEHIIIDGGSRDGSVEILKQVPQSGKQNDRPFDSAQGDILPNANYTLRTISETDSGIYDAINKGIKLATGDIIGLLHSDDFYKDEFVLEKYAEAFAQGAESREQSILANNQSTTNERSQSIDAAYSDLIYVIGKSKVSHRDGKTKNEYFDHSELKIEYSIIRYWKSHKIKKSSLTTYFSPLTTHHLLNGWMPPHPTLFIRKSIFEKYGLYRTDMKIAADYEMILRLFYKHNITSSYLPLTTYCMTIGGASNKSIKNIILKSREDYLGMKLNSLPFSIKTLVFKNLRKIPQFFNR